MVPHSITMRVTGVGSSPGERPGEVEGDPTVRPAQRRLTASTVVDPESSRTYEGAFSEPVWYAVRFSVDGEAPADGRGRVRFHPAPDGGERGTFLSGRVSPAGEFSWVVTSTGTPGPFAR